MSFGLSIGDIIRAIELAFTIHEKCFSKAHGANVQYLEFGKDIKSLGKNLQQLKEIFFHAFSHDQRPPWRHQREELGPALQPLLDVTGDFSSTLQECNKLLDDRSRFHRSDTNFVHNVVWWTGTEKDVKHLRERVHFHVTKIFFVIKPFEIIENSLNLTTRRQLLLGIRSELQALREDVIVIKGLLIQDPIAYRTETNAIAKLPSTPSSVLVRFMDSLDINRPKSFQGVSNFPLKEGFDALVFHFAQSTVEFNPGLDKSQKVPHETQYLSLLKTSWILQKLKESTRFKDAGPSSLWVDYMKELEKDIMKEFRRFDSDQLIPPSQGDIQRLPDSCFSIWIVEAASLQPPSLAEQGPLEDKILELDLPVPSGTLKGTLTMLRKSDVTMRMVVTDTDERNKDFLREQSLEFNIHQTKFVPAYAVPKLSRESPLSTNNLVLSLPGQEPKWHYLKTAKDVELFQQAITGHRVFHDMAAVTWSINGSGNPSKSGIGRLQLWQPDLLEPIQPDDLTVSLQRMSSTMISPKSPTESLRSRTESSIFSSNSLSSSNSITSSVTGPRGKATAILKPSPPVIVIFTICQDKYTFIHLPVLENLYIDPKSCKCRYSNNNCCKAVIESTTKRIEVRRFCAQLEGTAGLYTWDLAVLGSFRHPEFAKADPLPKIKYICLDFSTTAERVKFNDEFASITALRDADIRDYETNIRERRYHANHPPRR